jgi:Alpha/beta hydrolase domain
MTDLGRATVTGPVSGGSRGWSSGSPVVDFERSGYCADEYFLEGLATRYRLRSGAELSWDGRWAAEPVGTAPFKTRMLVIRPADPARFNGTVALLWNNVSGGFDAFGVADCAGLLSDGYAIVGVTAQRVGVHGQGEHPMGLTAWDGERYGSLSIPSDDYSFDIFTQAAEAVGPGRDVTGVDPLGGAHVGHVIATGGSQSAARLATYVNAVHPLCRVIDGFILTVYFGTGSPLEVGDAVVNVADPEDVRRLTERGSHLLRDDLDVPVMIVNSELEAVPCHPVRQPDTDRFRWWEVAGTAHSSAQVLRTLSQGFERDWGFSLPVAEGMNRVSTRPVSDAALHHMRFWVSGGTPPPVQPRIEFAGDPPQIVRDADGLAAGGIRLPQVEIPVACNSSIPLDSDFQSRLGGSCRPFSTEQLRARYGDRATYLSRFEKAAGTAVEAGILLPGDVGPLVAEAMSSLPADLLP